MKKELKQLVDKIEAENKVFNKSTKAQKRITIAQDCITRIKLNNLRLYGSNGFLDNDFEEILKTSKENDLKAIVNSSVTCVGCAKGGLFLSYVGRANKFKVSDLDSAQNDIDDNEHVKLLEIFTVRQLALIETAFEGTQHIFHYKNKNGKVIEVNFTIKEEEKAEEYYIEYRNSDERMIAICENIIFNNGKFVP